MISYTAFPMEMPCFFMTGTSRYGNINKLKVQNIACCKMNLEMDI